jgi:uncharacterized protein
MKCPSCTTTSLVMTDRSNIEIDYCPDCRGVWLDRGELDKIIERAAPTTGQLSPPPTPVPADVYRRDAPSRAGSRRDWDDDDDDRGPHPTDGRSGSKRRSKGFLGDLFEF